MALNIAFNYSGRTEIIDAVRALIAAGVPAQEIDEARLGEHLYTAGQPDPDLIIRTGGGAAHQQLPAVAGRVRRADLLLRRCGPTSREADLDAALDEFTLRQRRYGA